MPEAPPRTREAMGRGVRARSESPRRISLTKLRAEGELYPERDYPRPQTRGECEGGTRPCPFVGCRHNLFLDVSDGRNGAGAGGTIKYNFPDLEPERMDPGQSCSLDLSEHERTLEEVGMLLNVTRERARQIEGNALLRMPRRELVEFVADSDTIVPPVSGVRALKSCGCGATFVPLHGNQLVCKRCQHGRLKLTKTCKCGATFQAGGGRRYCSAACPARPKVQRAELTCPCGAKFTPQTQGKHVYCSKSCESRPDRPVRAALTIRNCAHCRERFMPRRRDQSFCTPRCAKGAHAARITRARAANREPRDCEQCHTRFTPRARNQRFCQPSCGQDWHDAQRLARQKVGPLEPIDCAECGSTFEPRNSRSRFCKPRCSKQWWRRGHNRTHGHNGHNGHNGAPLSPKELLREAGYKVVRTGRVPGGVMVFIEDPEPPAQDQESS